MLGIQVFYTITWIVYLKTDIARAATTTTLATSTSNLSCYDCDEQFKNTWDPYTECQYYPTQAPLRECLAEEKYCIVERVTYRSLTVSISRGCSEECWYGCYAYGFGLTRLKCTSCCLTPGCNTGSGASRADVMTSMIFTAAFVCVALKHLLDNEQIALPT